MIRFVYIGGQINCGDQAFAFWDTICDRFVEIDGETVFRSRRDLDDHIDTLLKQYGSVGVYRFTDKVWEPYDGHVVGMIDKLIEALISKNDYAYHYEFALDYIRQFVVQVEVERQVEKESKE